MSNPVNAFSLDRLGTNLADTKVNPAAFGAFILVC